MKTYRNVLGTLKVFFRAFLNQEGLVTSFKFPSVPLRVRNDLPTTQQLRKFYALLTMLRNRAVFLLLASSGLRVSEALQLTRENVDFERRMVIPNSHVGRTKQSWVTFYNTECEATLNDYLTSSIIESDTLFNVSRKRVSTIFHETSEKGGCRITPQTLRRWFCLRMLQLSIQEIYVDAFCGRTPKTVLLRSHDICFDITLVSPR